MTLSMSVCAGLVLLALAYSVQCSELFKALTDTGSEFQRINTDIGQNNPVFLERVKRWDFQNDGCHCSGYHIRCLKDTYCQWKHQSRHWKCQKDCCGFYCVENS